MRNVIVLILSALSPTVFAVSETVDLEVEQEPLLSVWNKVQEQCPRTRNEHRITNVTEPVTLKVEGANCRDVLGMLVDFDLGAAPSK